MINHLEVKKDKDIVIPYFPRKLEGSFWGMTTFFNPAHYKNKIKNYRRFRNGVKGQGLKLIAIELAFGGDDFELTDQDADILVQVRSNSVMWQKERLLNIGLSHLPQDCDKVAWIDCDVSFQNENWIKEASDILQIYNIVQLFSFIAYLPEQNTGVNLYNFSNKQDGGQPCFHFGIAYAYNMLGELLFRGKIGKSFPGVPGGAWACRRELLDKHRFFDSCVFGSNDNVMAHAIYGVNRLANLSIFSEKLKLKQTEWHRKTFDLLRASSFYVDGVLEHFWHGDLDKRNYESRELVAKKYDFDPRNDIMLNDDGCYEWSSAKKEMHHEAGRYFFARQEENINFSN